MKFFVGTVLNLLHTYYSKGGTKSIPYECAITGLNVVLFVNLMTILGLLKLDLSFLDFYLMDNSIFKYLFILLLFIPLNFLLKKIYPEKEIHEYTPKISYKRGISLFFLYLLFSMVFFIISIKI